MIHRRDTPIRFRILHLFFATIFGAISITGLAAQAEAILVEASETADATRIGMAIGERPFLVDTAGPRQVDVVIPETGIAFDLSALLIGGRGLRIDAARTLLDENSSRVRLVMNCDCSVAADIEGGMLWVSLRDAAQSALSSDAVDDVPAETIEAPSRFASAQAPVASPRPWPRGVAPSDDLEKPDFALETGLSNTATPGAKNVGTDVANEVQLAREALIRQLARAAEQGLLDFSSEQSAGLFEVPVADDLEPERTSKAEAEPKNRDQGDTGPSADDGVTDPLAAQTAPALLLRPQSAEVELPVRSRTARDKRFRTDRAETWVRRVQCAPDASFAMPEFRTVEAAQNRLAELRNDLVDEFDDFDPVIVDALSRLWVSLGFGAEAGLLLDLSAEPDASHALLKDLSKVVDGEHPAVTGPLALMGPCSPLASIWFEAAGFQLESGAAERQSPAYADAPHAAERTFAMIEAFGKMPVRLRLLLGPSLMRARLDQGDVATARKIDLVLRRMVAPPSAEHDLARARLLLMSSQPEEADLLFRRLAERNVPEAWDALLQLAERAREQPSPTDQSLADALGDAAMLARGGPKFRSLKVAEIRTRALSEGLGPALSQIADALRRAPQDAAILTDAAHAALETARADDRVPLEYARAVLDYANVISRFPSGDQARRRVAAELTGIGLANAALTILDPASPRGVPSLLREEARARISLQDGTGALRALGDLADPASAALRSEAFLLLSRPEDAFAELLAEPTATVDERARVALLSGNWSEASRDGPAARRILAAGMAQSVGEASLASRPDAAETEQAGVTQSDAIATEPVTALRGLVTRTPGAADAVLSPVRVGEDVTLGDAEAVLDGSRAIRGLIEEALPNG